MPNTITIATEGLLQEDGGQGGSCVNVVAREVPKNNVAQSITVRTAAVSTGSAVVARSAPVSVRTQRVAAPVQSARVQRETVIATTGCAVPVSGGGTPSTGSDLFTPSRVNGHILPLRQGQVVCSINGQWFPADSSVQRSEVVGFIIDDALLAGASGQAQMTGLMTMTLAQWELVTDQLGGLVPETPYYLGPSGRMTINPPETVGVVVRVGYAITSTQFSIDIDNPVFL